MSSKYQEFSKLNLPDIEKEILEKWEAEKTFEKSVEQRDEAEPFVFYEGPPSANGLPGIHHVISRSLKDLVCRYKTMKGFQVRRKGGWDTHGLPVELSVEKMLGITKEDIGKKISVEEYNETCRKEVLKYKDKWGELTRKMGYWVDLHHPYITFENDYIETLWWCLKQLYDKQLLYKDVSIQPYSPAAGTGLSSHELNQPGTYREVKDTSCVAMFGLTPALSMHGEGEHPLAKKLLAVAKKHNEFSADEENEVFLLAWTTTPWTLPSNLALTVGAKIEYILIKTFNPYTHLPVNVVLAKPLINQYFHPEAKNGNFEIYKEGDKLIPWKILTTFSGKDMEGMRYEQLMPFEANKPELANGDPFQVLLGDFVTTEDGTGIVHTAPAFGADDFKIGKKYGIGILTLVDREGKFIDGVGEFSGRYVKNYKDDPEYVDVNVDICVKLKKENCAFKIEKFEHSYPHCWRTDKPIIYYPLDAWFIKTTAMRDRMVELNKTINWKPAATGTGRFGNWLENMVDWNLSRSRFWGTPLPVWTSEDRKEMKCIGSIAELKEEINKANEKLGKEFNNYILHEHKLDLHKPFVDEIVLVSDSGQPMYREPDLVDVWFDSGAMPYAQWHFPFENKNKILSPSGPGGGQGESFPADFIAEGVDQTRGWFYTLHALAVMLFDSVAYKTVVSNGLVLDKNGNKMSKRLGNAIDPFITIEKYSADATRWYLITNASPWESLKFNIEGIKEAQRKFFGTLFNIYNFFAMYANLDNFKFKEAYIPVKNRPEIDRWIISSLNSLLGEVDINMNDYEPTRAGRAIQDFVDEKLSNWYVRLCRRRFWKGEYEHDKICAYQTLYECLEKIAGMMAPISPFFADWLYLQLDKVTKKVNKPSIHLTYYPKIHEEVIDKALEERMQLAQDISSLVLSLRKKVNIKVRQPLQKLLIPVSNNERKEQLQKIEELIKNEVNIKEVNYLDAADGFIKKKIKPNYKALGKKLGPLMKAVATELSLFTDEDIQQIEKEGTYELIINEKKVPIQLDEVEIVHEDIPGWTVANKDNLTVALDVTVTPELMDEGNARELVNRIQKIRKESEFELTDRIDVKLDEVAELKTVINNFNDYICTEILADSLEMVPQVQSGTEIEVNDRKFNILVNKINQSNANH